MTGVAATIRTAIWQRAWTTAELAALTKGTLVDHLGIVFTTIGDDHLVAELPVDERTTQRMGYLHGGASLALAETVGSLASQMCVDRDRQAAMGLDINANHVRPVPRGRKVRAIAKPLHLGRQTHVWEVRVETEDEKLVCIARLTTAIHPRKSNGLG
jgi:1,4-dihydroxy-2-naphthoyl-CoA hydrolase